MELRLSDFAAIHASPPCQGYTRGNAGRVTKWPRLIPAVRDLLIQTGLPYVIENVRDAAPHMFYPELLCGCMFDLSVRDYTCTSPGEHDGTCDTKNGVEVHLERGRLFETNWEFEAPRPCEGKGQPRNNHPSHEWVAGAYGGSRRDKYEARFIRKGGYVPPEMNVVKALLGIDHGMTWNGLFECIPPAYTHYVGGCLRRVLDDATTDRGSSLACSTCTYLNRVQKLTRDPIQIERIEETRARHLEDARKGPMR
jgi:DNA (cytosine-5)-methyltransferase 1